MVKTRKMRDLVPDVEFLKYREVCLKMIQKIGNCEEAHFGLGMLYAYEANFDAALSHIKIAFEQSQLSTFHSWVAVLTVFRVNSKKKALKAKNICYGKKYLELIRKATAGVEVYWALIVLSFTGYLEIGVDIEKAEHYAAKIKAIDDYFGLLAWSEILLRDEKSREKGEILIKELVRSYPYKPEAYVKLWNFYYYTVKNYKSALETAEKTFICEVGRSSEYSVIISLNYARSLFKNSKLRSCLELLQLEYTKHSLFTVILYHYGRLCVKSKDSLFLGSAIGALEECLKTCSETRHGQIYYWLTFAYLQAEEKLEAYQCAQKGVTLLSGILDKLQCIDPSFQRTLTKKISGLQKIIKDLHIHVINIEMIETVLDDFSEFRMEECKLYCESIMNFDILESRLYQAKMWWALGNRKKAKKILYGELSCTRVKMKAYFLLMEFCKYEETGVEEMLGLSREIVKKCRSPMIPVQIWISANMAYAKCLAKHGKVQEALLVYKSLAQVQPIPFIPDMNYTRELQRCFTRDDLDNIVMRLEKKEKRYSYLSSSITDFHIQRSKLVYSRQLITTTLIGEDEEDYEKNSDRSKTVSTERTEMSDSGIIGSRAPEPLPKSRISSIPCGNSANIGFSVTSNYDFLYKIGKTCAKYDVRVPEGLLALHDYLNAHHYWTIEGIEIHEEIKVKAMFWLGMLYQKSRQYSMAGEVFHEILSMLFQLGRTKMSSEAQRLLKLNQEKCNLEENILLSDNRLLT